MIEKELELGIRLHHTNDDVCVENYFDDLVYLDMVKVYNNGVESQPFASILTEDERGTPQATYYTFDQLCSLIVQLQKLRGKMMQHFATITKPKRHYRRNKRK